MSVVPSSFTPTRRALAKGAAWTVPAVAVAAAAPAFAGSGAESVRIDGGRTRIEPTLVPGLGEYHDLLADDLVIGVDHPVPAGAELVLLVTATDGSQRRRIAYPEDDPTGFVAEGRGPDDSGETFDTLRYKFAAPVSVGTEITLTNQYLAYAGSSSQAVEDEGVRVRHDYVIAVEVDGLEPAMLPVVLV